VSVIEDLPSSAEAAPDRDAPRNDADLLPTRTKAAFGVGGLAEGALGIAFSTFALLFYRNQLDLSGTLVGVAMTIALLVDAVSDPLVGSLSDRVRTRFGRRHPFLFIAPIPLAASFTAIFMPPEGLGTTGLFLWLTGFAILTRTFMTFYQVPHLALGAELSPNYLERTRVMSHNAIYQLIGGASTFFLGWTWFGAVDGGTASRSAFGLMGACVAVVAAAAIVISALFTRDRIPKLHVPPISDHGFSIRALTVEIVECLKNRNYAALLLGLVFLGAAAGLHENLFSFMSLFFWELPEESIRWIAAASPPSYILAFIATAKLHDRLDKRETMIGAMVVVAIASALPVVCRFLGLFPENGSESLLPLLLLNQFGFTCGIAVLTITVMSALADIADQHELTTGRRQEGVFYSARTFFGKVTTAAGSLLSGLGLDLIGFSAHSVPGEVAPEVITGLGVLDSIVPAVPATLAVFCYAAYRIDKRTHREIREELAKRAEAKA